MPNNWPNTTAMIDYFSSNVGSVQLSVPRVAPQVGGYADATYVADTTYVVSRATLFKNFYTPSFLPDQQHPADQDPPPREARAEWAGYGRGKELRDCEDGLEWFKPAAQLFYTVLNFLHSTVLN